MIMNGTWKGEPASEESWEVDIDWSIAEPDPEFLGREAFDELFLNNADKYQNYPWIDTSKEAAVK